ncbi:MAG: hypothetical protein EKK41_26100 [Hyphomicrobiales bacterium]|nr:MAG: hypothetical protein EKK41_26100 [Hyphomicrobiales bacterium]
MQRFLSGGGELGALIRSHPWSDTPLGPPSTWPQSLRSAISICLNSSFPTAIYWGSDFRLLYNDAWSVIPAERHPWALGRPGAEVWADIWDVVGPQFERVFESGEGFSTYDQMLPMVRDGTTRETYWNYSITAIRGEDGSVVGIFNQGNETTAQVMARRQSHAEIERLTRMFAQAPSAVAVMRGPNHEFEIVNAAYEKLVGRSGLVGKPIAEALPEVVPQGFIDLLDQVRTSARPYVGYAVPVLLQRTPSGPPEERLLDFVYQPLIDGAGQSSGIFVQAADLTEQRRAEKARDLIVREMQHRISNLFSIATSLVSLSSRTASSAGEMADDLRGKLLALSRAHRLIQEETDTRQDKAAATLASLLAAILAPYQAPSEVSRIVIGGPGVSIGAEAMTSLALIFHELATNAAKYGALGDPAGKLTVDWEVDDRQLTVSWREWCSLGATEAEPMGFGSKLIESAATQLGGVVAASKLPGGMSITLSVPRAPSARWFEKIR